MEASIDVDKLMCVLCGGGGGGISCRRGRVRSGFCCQCVMCLVHRCCHGCESSFMEIRGMEVGAGGGGVIITFYF